MNRGEVEARLDEHDKHLSSINGSVARQVEEQQKTNLLLQRILDQRAADQEKVIATAAALKEADQARRDKAEWQWTPVSRLIAVVGTIGTLLTIYFLVRPR